VVEVQMRVDDDVDAGEVEGLLAQWDEAGIEVGHRRVQLRRSSLASGWCRCALVAAPVDTSPSGSPG
jgi:hypothetical protein